MIPQDSEKNNIEPYIDLYDRKNVPNPPNPEIPRQTGEQDIQVLYVENSHEAIIDKKTFDAVQAEIQRRSAGKEVKPNGVLPKIKMHSRFYIIARKVCKIARKV